MRLVNRTRDRAAGGVRRRRWALWLSAMAAGLVTALIGFPGVESGLRELKNAVHAHSASGQVAVVEIDDRSLAALGRWPIPRHVYAQLIDTLFAHGARSVTFDIDLSSTSTRQDDQALAEAISRHPQKVTLADRIVPSAGSDALMTLEPLRSLARDSKIANISFSGDDIGNVTRLPYAFVLKNKTNVGMAAAIAGYNNGQPFSAKDGDKWSVFLARLIPNSSFFPIDGSIRIASIPKSSLVELLNYPRSAEYFREKNIIVGMSSEQGGDMYSVPPYGRIAGVWLQAIGAETLINGKPLYLGFAPAFITAGIIIALALTVRRRMTSIMISIAGSICILIFHAILPRDCDFDVVPAVVTLLVAAACLAALMIRETLRSRATINQISGLLNLTALRSLPTNGGTRLVAAHIHNFAEATATMPASGEAALIAQVASRLRLGMTEGDLYHGDNGVFAWFSREPVETVGERLDALHALFRSAVTIEDSTLDLVVTFGVDDDAGRSIANRLGSALVAATEAHADGARWREFDRAKLADTAWKLSMLSELDAAIDDGALWVAYQPKLDLRQRRIVGAEALVRWTHPEKGAISPIEFIAAAEQHNRIERLTAHVLERAVLAAATINAHDIGFGIAVNLSARLLDVPGLVDQVESVLARHRLDPARLTLEVTETATLASGRSLDALHELRALGVHISIDDYGTGLSTLEYLRKIPAGEIKIDRSFVQAVLSSSSDLLMVNSTIQLAHSLGHSVVAEGVESADILARLTELGCDVAQGYHIGRPMTFQDLARRLLAERRQAA